MAVITRSCRAPQTTNVTMSEAVGGNNRLSGEYTYLDNPYPQIGFQYCQNPAKDPAPRERRNMFRSEPEEPTGTPLRRRMYWARVNFYRCWCPCVLDPF